MQSSKLSHKILFAKISASPFSSDSQKVSAVKALWRTVYYIHSALAAKMHSWSLATVVPQGVCGKAWEFTCIIWWTRLLLEAQESKSSTKDYEGKPGLLFLMQVDGNKPKGMFHASCSIFTARNTGNWKYSKVTLRSPSCSNSRLEWFLTNCSQTSEAVITNWYKSSNDNPDCSI